MGQIDKMIDLYSQKSVADLLRVDGLVCMRNARVSVCPSGEINSEGLGRFPVDVFSG